MKVLIVSCLVVALASMALADDTLETCSCWKGYRPQMMNDKPMCVGIMLLAIKPCNIPEPPRCKCDPAIVTGITSDSTGTRCSQYERGIELKSWPCENAEEWDTYKKSLANKPE